MKHIRNIALVFFIIAVITVVTSCKEDDGSGYIYRMNLENNPQNLDAQMATDNESIMIITNMMEGLMKVQSNGAIVPAAAERFEMSDDGLKYTFYLKKQQMWESLSDFTSEVTADDFVFAFQRIFDKETKSPYRDDYLCIKNAKAIVNGSMNEDALGVKAVDKYTVEITLEYPYYDFLNLLTKSAAMPCNRNFFDYTKGKYGMSADATASNGAFYLKEWNYDPYWDNNYIIMRRNNSYSEKQYVYPYSLNFFITEEGDSDKLSFSEGNIDCYISDKYDDKVFSKNNYSSYQTGTVGLLFNTNAEYVNNYKVREALVKSINREAYVHELSENLSTAYGIIPGDIRLQGRSYRDLAPDKVFSVYDINASSIWENVLSESGITSIENLKITVPDSFEENELIYNISDQWRENLLVFSTVEIISETEYDLRMADKLFSIALVELNAEENSVFEFFDYFTSSEYSKLYVNTKLYSDVRTALFADSLSDAVLQYENIEREILDQYLFVPLFYKNEYFVSHAASTDVIYHPFISSAEFANAKYYD